MAGIINRHPAAVVFGCNTLFFYKMLPFLTPQVKVVDLLHAFGGGAEYFALPVLHRIDKRVVITAVTREDIAHQYQCYGIDKALVERVVLIENRVEVPLVCSVKRMADRLNILYVGRGSEEKRLHLIGQIAALCKRNELPVTIRLVGDVAEGLPESDRAFCEIIGEVTDRERLASLYDEAHMLILTSSREGFPVVVMEAMARGVVPLTTDVGGISDHVSNGISGWLVPNDTDEEVIVKTMYGIIERACSDRSVLTDMACAAYSHAKEHFRNDRFCAAYRILLLGPQA